MIQPMHLDESKEPHKILRCSEKKLFKRRMNLIYEHQMIQALAYLEKRDNLMTHEVFVLRKGNLELLDYACLKNKY